MINSCFTVNYVIVFRFMINSCVIVNVMLFWFMINSCITVILFLFMICLSIT